MTTRNRPRRLLQFSLMTAVMTNIAAGALMWLNMSPQEWQRIDWKAARDYIGLGPQCWMHGWPFLCVRSGGFLGRAVLTDTSMLLLDAAVCGLMLVVVAVSVELAVRRNWPGN
jgi:hypothetical protein